MKNKHYTLFGIILLAEIGILSFIKKVSFSLSFFLVMALLLLLYVLLFVKKNNKTEFVFILTALSALVFMPYLLKTNIFCFLNDQYIQYDYISEEWSRLITKFVENGSFPFYSFNSFLGNNFYASKLYYVTGDILHPIIMLFEDINEGYLFETILIIICSGYFSYCFFEKFGISNRKVIITVSILYAFSGTSAFFLSEYFWHRFYAAFPLLLYGVETYREEGKTTIFSIAVALCFLTSYYLMFPASIFLILYFIFTFIYHKNSLDIFEILKKSVKLIVCYFFGFLLTGLLIIPAIINILNNERVGSGVNINLLFDFRVYLGYLYNIIIAPLSVGTAQKNYFISSDDYHLWGYSIYINSIIAPVTFSYCFNSNRKYKSLKILIIIMTTISLIPTLNSIMHGFSGASLRWTFITAFVYLLGLAVVFDDGMSFSTYTKGLALFLIIFLVFTTAAVLIGIMPIDFNNTQFVNACISIFLLILYSLLLKKGKISLILVICIIETITMFMIFQIIANSEYAFYEDSLDRNVLTYINDQDKDKFYRNCIDYNNLKPFVNDLNLNQSLHYGYKSVESYDTTYENNLNEFLEMNKIDTHIMELTNTEVLKMLGVRYYYVLDESQLPKTEDFTFITNNNNFKVYKLNNYRPIGFTYSLFTTSKEGIIDNNLWNNVLYVDEELFETANSIVDGKNYDFNLIEYYDDNNLKGSINLDETRVLYFSIPYNDGWKVKDNGRISKIYKVQGGFIGVILEPGDHYIELNFVPPGFKVGCVATLVGFIGIFIVYIFEKKKNKHYLSFKEDK